jgi:type IV pilus assembly protein PilB
MRTLTEEGVRLVGHGITTIGEVMRSIYMVGS